MTNPDVVVDSAAPDDTIDAPNPPSRSWAQMSRSLSAYMFRREKEWAGLPMPIPGLQLTVEATHAWRDRVMEMQGIVHDDPENRPPPEFGEDSDPDEDGWTIHNEWFSHRLGVRVGIGRKASARTAFLAGARLRPALRVRCEHDAGRLRVDDRDRDSGPTETEGPPRPPTAPVSRVLDDGLVPREFAAQWGCLSLSPVPTDCGISQPARALHAVSPPDRLLPRNPRGQYVPH